MSRPGFIICVCPDAQLMKEHIEEQLCATPATSATSATSGNVNHEERHSLLGNWERHVYWGDEQLPPVFWENLTLQGLFATPKALVVRNAQNLKIDDWKKLSQSLGNANEQAWPFLCLEVAFDRGKAKVPAAIKKLACWKFAEKQGWIWESAGLDDKTLRSFIQKTAASLGVRIKPQAANTLALALPADASAARNELEKLALAAAETGEITQELAETVHSEADMDIFAFINAIQQGNSMDKVWGNILRSQSGGDQMIFPFLAMLLREARILWQINAGEQVRLPAFILGKKQQLAKKLGYGKLARIWHLAMEAEKGIKSGERSPEQAMEMLVAGLFSLFGTGQSPQIPPRSALGRSLASNRR